ncbi:MAG: YceI family protein [Parvularculaceae bacterium]
MRSFRFAVIPLLLLAAGCADALSPLVKPNVVTSAEALRAGDYKLDPDHGAIIFHVNHLGFSQFPGRFDRFDASLDFDSEHPENARVAADIDMTSLNVGNEEFAATLTGGQWFDAAQYPTAHFESRAIAVTGDNRGTMTGDLTMHGVTQPVTLDVVFNGGARDRLRGGSYVVGFTATGTISRAAFGVDRFSALVGDEVAIEIQTEFVKN